MRNRIGADVIHFSRRRPYTSILSSNYRSPWVYIEWRKSHGAIASVSRASHQLQHQGMRTTRAVAFRSFFVGSDSRFRFWLFAPITFDHELKELTPQTVLRLEQKRDVLWSGFFLGTFDLEHKVGRVSLFLELAPCKNRPFCSTEQKRDVLW